MAYADTSTTTRRTGTAIAVLALEAGLAWALINGFAMTGEGKLRETFTAIFIPKEKQPPPPPPPPQAKDRQQPRDAAPVKAPETTFDALKGGGALIVPTGPIAEPGGGEIGEVKFPEIAEPQPRPSFAPRLARPRGNPGQWVSANDYPTRDLAEGNEGLVRFRLEVSAQGKVTACTITQSSGHPGLDAATCDKLPRRAKFDPASDATGAPATGTYTGAVRWQIPE